MSELMSNYSPYFTILKLSQSSVITIIIIWTTVCLLPLTELKVWTKFTVFKQKARNRQYHLNSWVNSNGARVKVKVQRFVCRHLARQDEQSRYFKVCFTKTMTGRPGGTGLMMIHQHSNLVDGRMDKHWGSEPSLWLWPQRYNKNWTAIIKHFTQQWLMMLHHHTMFDFNKFNIKNRKKNGTLIFWRCKPLLWP